MDKSAPRFQAGSMSLPEGAGEITAMCSCVDFLEIYTESATYRVRSPESIDPEVTNPNAPWVSAKSSDFGSSNEIIARVLLQGSEMLQAALVSNSVTEKEQIVRQLYQIKETLLACEKVRMRVTAEVESIICQMSEIGLEVENGRHIKSLPQVANLNDDATSFLINTKRAIARICNLAGMFLPLKKKHSNPDHLKKSVECIGDERYASLIKALEHFAPGARHLIELRNFQEHPGEKETIIENFSITAANEIGPPVWYVSGNDPESISASMSAAIDFVISFCETVLVHLIFSTMESKIPYYVQEISGDEINPKKPIKYRLSINVDAIEFKG